MEAPKHWEEVLKNLREMRKDLNADVDSMGCEKCHDDNEPVSVQRYQKLIALMLSSQTKDTVTFAAMKRLRDHGLNVSSITSTDQADLGQLIYPVGFWKTKAKNIKLATEMLREKFHDDIPETVDELCTLPGVGPKMAHLCMKSAWGKVTGIAVDTHVHRIANRLNWAKNTKTPSQTQKQLESWIPKPLWNDINLLLVGFGQQICFAKKPNCNNCLNRNYCLYFQSNKKSIQTDW